MTRSVVYSPRAQEQLTALYVWIAEQSGYPARAEGFVSAILDFCDDLATHPMIGIAREDLRPGLRTIGFRRRDRVRHDVDAGAASGSYILAGSSFPSEAPKHSGAGRIVTLRMRPLSLAERQLAEPTVSLAALLDGTSDIDGDCDLTLEDYTDEITTSGFPGIRPLPPEVRRDALDGYLTAVVERDFVDAGASRTRGQCPSRGTAPCWERCSRAW